MESKIIVSERLAIEYKIKDIDIKVIKAERGDTQIWFLQGIPVSHIRWMSYLDIAAKKDGPSVVYSLLKNTGYKMTNPEESFTSEFQAVLERVREGKASGKKTINNSQHKEKLERPRDVRKTFDYAITMKDALEYARQNERDAGTSETDS